MQVRLKNAEDMLKQIQLDNRYNKVKVEYHNKLSQLAGQIVDIETDYLFDDQYNTPPIPNISDIGLRLFDRHIAEVIDDVRPGMVKCAWCGESYQDTGTYCHSTLYINHF